jgi:Uma2 family endonuclease
MPMVVQSPPVATLEDLYQVDGKAELIDGRIVRMPTGYGSALAAGEIYASLRDYVRTTGRGVALPDGAGFAQRPKMPSGRESFSPDAAYYTGPPPANRMRFIDGAPDFAAEVRSETNRERDIAAKRIDYFLAGTLVIWDVDPEDQTVTVYRAGETDPPRAFRRGDTVDAEPAVPGWTMRVDEIFG